MSLLDKLTKDMVAVMKAKDKETLSTVRMLKASVQNEKIKLGHELSEEEENSLLAREYKQRKEALEEFVAAKRQDLIDKTKAEMSVVEKYMPKQLSDDEIKQIVAEAVQATGADSMKDFGKVMKSVMPKVKGKADGKVVNQTVKDALQK